ncbi:MAG: FYDLN acid domain-containing protein, partial [Alphaproteobacteria bacterium]|nr:FYDLN acid domain-containing protein [Alphaproteobacteria bacterium]
MFSIGVRRHFRAADSWEILSVAKAEWGAKHDCLSCGAKFYDMGRNPITCPACETPFAAAAPGRTRRARKAEVKEVEA